MPVFWLSFVAALASALVGGVFFGFSSFIMQGLARLPAAEGAHSMQEINRTAVTPVFMTALFGNGLLCLVLIPVALISGLPGCESMAAGAALYFLSNPGVTMVCNVPLNNRLDKLDPASAEAADFWATYLKAWTRWNTVRAIGGVAASVLLVAGLLAL